jgi:hypothetical protein
MDTTRLYTWLDVEAVVERQQLAGSWPRGLVAARVYPDAVELSVENEGAIPNAYEALERWFGRRFDRMTQAIDLESAAGAATRRRLDVLVVVEPGDTEVPGTRPTFSRVSLIPDAEGGQPTATETPPVPFPADYPLVVAFYSYKGGVGRTLHLAALAKALSEHTRSERPRLLLVDADMEAPGLTWWMQRRGPAEISLLDYLALAHYETDPGFRGAVELAAQRIRLQPVTIKTADGMADQFFLPTFRDPDQLLRLLLRPEHLTQLAGREWVWVIYWLRWARNWGWMRFWLTCVPE